jgi:serine/threonine protein kinase
MIAGYEIVRALGAGGFGITYEGFNRVTERRVAIKEFFPRGIASREGATQIVFAPSERELAEWALRRFRESTTALARLQHRNIVGVLNYVAEHGTGYMVMEHVDGETLERWLRVRPSPPSLEDLRAVLDPVCDALEYIHVRNILHRDIAPDNVMIAADRRPVLIDFGAIKVIEQETLAKSGTSFPVGKRFYSPPEQFTSQSPDARTDIYALGAVIYRALTGTPPADAEYRKAEIVEGRSDPYQLLASLPGIAVSASAAEAVDRALSVRRDLRPASIAAFREMLRWGARPAGPRPAKSPFAVTASDASLPIIAARIAPSGAPPPIPLPDTSNAARARSWLDAAPRLTALGLIGAILVLGGVLFFKRSPDAGAANPVSRQAKDVRPPITLPVPSPLPAPAPQTKAPPAPPPRSMTEAAPANVPRAWIGVRIQAVNPQLAETLKLPAGEGVLIVSVEASGPAQRAGLLANEVILRINGKPVTATREVGELLNAIGIGRTATLTIHGPREVRVVIGSTTSAESVATRYSNAWLGVAVSPLDASAAAKETIGVNAGALVVRLDPSGVAMAAGVLAGDVITGAAGEDVRSPADLFSVIGRNKIGAMIDVTLFRAGKAITVKLTLRELPASMRPARAPVATTASGGTDPI